MTVEGKARRPRRRLWKYLVGAVVLLALLALALPVVAAPFVRSKVEQALEQQLAVDAEINELSFTLGGSLHVAGLRLTDDAGRVVCDLERLDASVGVLRALAGTYVFDVQADGLHVELHEEDDGTWNVSKLPRAHGPRAEEPSSEPGSFDLRGQARLTNAVCLFVRADSTIVRANFDADARFDGPSQPAQLHGGLELVGSGRMVASAELPGDPGRWSDVPGLTGRAALNFEQPFDLAALGPALGPFLPFEVRAGVLVGSGEVSTAPGLDLRASAAFALEGLELHGPRASAAPVRLKKVSLDASTQPGPDGALVPLIALKADDALSLEVKGTLTGAGGPSARLDGTLALGGDVGELKRLSLGWIAFQEGLELEGALVGNGTFDVALADQSLAEAGAQLELGFEGLKATDAVKGPIDLGALADPRLSAQVSYDGAAGELRVPAFVLAAGPLHAEGSTALSDLGGAAPRVGASRLDATADLDALAKALKDVVDLGGAQLAGRIEAHVEATADGSRLPLLARLETHGLVFGQQGGQATEYGDLTAGLKGVYDGGAGTLALDELTAACTGLDVRGKAALSGLDRAEGTPDADFDLVVDADPSHLPGWVQGILGDKRVAGAEVRAKLRGTWKGGAADVTADITGRDIELDVPGKLEFRAGSLRHALQVSGMPESLRLKGNGELLALDLRVEPSAPAPAEPAEEGKPAAAPPAPGKAIELAEPRLIFDVDATVAAKPGDLELRKLHLESFTLTGDVSGRVAGLASLQTPEGAAPAVDVTIEALQGDLVYVPDKLALALGPYLPGELSGSEPEPCKFRLDGRLRGVDAPSLIAGLTGTVDLGVGRYRQTGLDVAGDAHVELKDGKASLTSALKANGGDLAVGGTLGIAPGPNGLVTENPHLTLGAKDVQANSGLGPMLGFLHPAFASLDAAEKTEIAGAIDCDVDLRYDGTLDTAALAAGWDALPKEPINGKISFALDGGSIAGSPLVQQVLGKLNLGGKADFALKPVHIDVKAGRLHYAEPWEWKMFGSQTSFGGSIGLDKTLDLKWSVPVTAELAARNELLGKLEGQTLAINIGGTITRPKVETGDLLKGLAESVVESEIKDALKSIGGKAGGDAGAAGESKGSDPSDILARADDLWKQGDKASAAALYRELRDKHKVSLVYAMNRDRIKERSEWKP